jgi:hypothetical protein
MDMEVVGTHPPDTLVLDGLPGPRCTYPWRCTACGRGHPPGAVCRELKAALWAIVKDRTDGPAYRWARARLELDDGPEVVPSRQAPTEHICGWAELDGTWRCVADFYAVGDAPETGCGATWTPKATDLGGEVR